MVDVLQNSSNPKHRNSEFLKFLNQLNTGAIDIQGDQIVENAEKMQEFQAQEIQRVDKEKVRQQEEEKFNAEHEKHVAMLREQDDVDEIQDEYS
jgi:hypothetical protein